MSEVALSQAQSIDDRPVVRIRASRGIPMLNLHEIWDYRDLLYFLLWREVKGRYRQMALGPLWIIVSPLVNMVIFSLIFGGLAQLPSDGIPYPLFTYVALLPWRFFATCAGNGAQSLVMQQQLISKVYFPRLIIPLASVLSALVDFLASFVILVGMLLFYRITPTWAVLSLPFFLLIAGAAGLGIGLWLAGLTVKFRDVNMGLGYALTAAQYLTPVAYASSLIPAQWRTLYQLNPMTVVVDGFRWALLGVGSGPDWTLTICTVVVAVVLVTGAYIFRMSERTIVDVL